MFFYCIICIIEIVRRIKNDNVLLVDVRRNVTLYFSLRKAEELVIVIRDSYLVEYSTDIIRDINFMLTES